MENKIKEAVAQTVKYWATQITPTGYMASNLPEFEQKKAVALAELERALTEEFALQRDGKLTVACHHFPGHCLEKAITAGWGAKHPQTPWPRLPTHTYTETTVDKIKAGGMSLSSPPIETIWAAS